MWAKVDDAFARHPKVYIASDRLGGGRPAKGRVLAVWLEGRLWASAMNTNGFIPSTVVAAFECDDRPLEVATAMSTPITDQERVRWNVTFSHCLWEATGGGFLLHDDEKYKPKPPSKELQGLRSEYGRKGGIRSGETRRSRSKTEATSKQNTNPVSRIPVPGSPDSEYPDPSKAVCTREIREFAAFWNEATTSPIAPCLELTVERLKQIEARLSERPLQAWTRAIAKVAASAFCNGENRSGWAASIDWLIKSPDIGVRVLEGQFDDRAKSEPPISSQERERAWTYLRQRGQCPHEPRCQSSPECVGNLVWLWRQQERGAA